MHKYITLFIQLGVFYLINNKSDILPIKNFHREPVYSYDIRIVTVKFCQQPLQAVVCKQIMIHINNSSKPSIEELLHSHIYVYAHYCLSSFIDQT